MFDYICRIFRKKWKEMNTRKIKCRYVSIIAILTVIAVILYIIELVTSKPVFDITRFTLNYVVSLPFMLLSIVMNCGIAVMMNWTELKRCNISIKVAAEGTLAVLAAMILVLAGNLPFIDDISGYVHSRLYWKSVAASALINISILVLLEFFIQASFNQRLRNENAVLQYRQLKSQINPHFLFNSLNTLVSLINSDSGLAVKYTKRLSSVYRYVLTQDRRDTVTVREEVDFIEDYIGIIKIRFGEGLVFRFDIRDSDLDRQVPPMALQLLVENAVKHNAISPEAPLTVIIATDGKSLCVTNSTAPRLSPGRSEGIGLENLSKKYALLSGGKISVSKTASEFSVKLPLL